MHEPANEPTIQQLFDLRGRTALVTGGSGYLGGALATALAEAGARVAVTATDQHRAEQAAARLPPIEAGPHAGLQLDHLDEAEIAQQVGHATDALGGPLDILVNNAHEPLARDWRDVDGASFSRQLSNATGYFLLARHVRDQAVEAGRPASIVMLGSMYGLVGCYPDAYRDVSPISPAAYHALKGGIVQLTRHLAVAWAGDRVRVNCLSPGPFPSSQAPAELIDRLAQRTPLGRIGVPHELKGAIAFLASDASRYVTGHNLVVDGGWTAW